ncbi:MAG: hypothetical protein WCO48_01400 [Candidatus Taylorbacteria bacterium]
MKEINIIWDKVTPHSRFWAIIIFIGVLPAMAFYVGMVVEKMNETQSQLYQFSQETLLQSSRGMCRISDCTLQDILGAKKSDSIQVVSPKQGDHINLKSSVKVVWNTSPDFTSKQVALLLLDSKGNAASKTVKATTTVGSTTISLSVKASKEPYTVLIQGVKGTSTMKEVPFAYSGEFYL